MAEYICYLFEILGKPAGVASTHLTALGHYWTCHGANWDRKKYPTLSKMMKGYRRIKPSQIRKKKPFSWYLIKKAFRYIDMNTYNGQCIAAAVCIGYFFGGRVGEYAANSREDWPHIVRECDLTWIGPPNNLKSLIIDFRDHKTNKLGIYAAKVEAICSCNLGICPVHIINCFLKSRNNIFCDVARKPLLIHLRAMPLRQQHINNFLKNIAIRLKLNPTDYSSHSLRSGRATDLAIAKCEPWFIKKWGRWRSNCWEDHYAKLDFTDIAVIANKSLQELGLSRNSI